MGTGVVGGSFLNAGCTQDALPNSGITRTMPSAAATSARSPKIIAMIGNQTVQRAQVLEWEARRIQVVAQRMKSNILQSTIQDLSALFLRPNASYENIEQERELLAQAKIKAGDNAMRALVRNDLLVSDAASSLASLPKQYSASVTELHCDMGSAQGFVDWFSDLNTQDNRLELLRACPDHYLIRKAGDTEQEVIEETGGALVVSHFQIACSKTGSLPHQFDDSPTGFKSKLTVYFPATLPYWYVTEHRWHLGCEFSNWITAYLKDTKQLASG